MAGDEGSCEGQEGPAADGVSEQRPEHAKGKPKRIRDNADHRLILYQLMLKTKP